MKNLLLASVLMSLILIGCEKEFSAGGGDFPEYSIEGMWVLEDYPNTAYIFENDLRYTVYCTSPNCNWDTVTTADAIPNPESYTFENDTLKIDLGFGNFISDYMKFDCGGEVIKREYDTDQFVRWSRPSYDVSTCAN
jgi:hypothetical protein